jgi:hypothetical protein
MTEGVKMHNLLPYNVTRALFSPRVKQRTQTHVHKPSGGKLAVNQSEQGTIPYTLAPVSHR